MKKENSKPKNPLAKQWFDQWSNDYDQTMGRMRFHKGLLDLAIKNSSVKKGDQVLDIGCGTGLLSLKFLKNSDCIIQAIDSSPEMLKIFNDKIRQLGLIDHVSCQVMDADSLKFNASQFDIIASTLVLHHLEDKLKTLQTIYHILKPQGRFILGEVDMDTTGCPTDLKRLKRLLPILEKEWFMAMKEVGIDAFITLYENGLRHLLNRGEYCLSLKQWAGLCKKAGFQKITIKRVKGFSDFGIVVAEKN